jgi:WD40 repeat protein
MRLFDIRVGHSVRGIRSVFGTDPVMSVAFGTSVQDVFAAAGTRIFSFDLRAPSLLLSTAVWIAEENKDEINQIAIGPNSLLASADDSGSIQVFQTAELPPAPISLASPPNCLRTISAHGSQICSTVSFYGTQFLVSGGFDSRVCLYLFLFLYFLSF